jgi:hypothetical protein
MATIFGPEWDAVELSDIQRFLDGADAQPLVWAAKGEAKGTDIDRERQSSMCALGG